MNDFGIVLGIHGHGCRVHKFRQIGGATNGFKIAFFLEKIGQGHKVDGFIFLKEIDDARKNLLMCGAIEVLRNQSFKDIVQGAVVQHYGAEKGLFRLQILGWNGVNGCVFFHRVNQWVLMLQPLDNPDNPEF